MKRQIALKRMIGLVVANAVGSVRLASWAIGVSLILTSSPALAVPILGFDDVNVEGGTVSYAGGAAAAIGTDILFDQISGTGTPLNNGAILGCSDCKLNFTSGANTFNSSGLWTWGGPGNLAITGIVFVDSGSPGLDGGDTVLAGSIGNPVTLVSGTFTNAIAAAGGGQLTFNGFGIDTKHQSILDYYGLTTNDFNFANTEISTSPTFGANNSFDGIVNNADFNNTNNPAVPEPSTVILLGSGLIGLAAWRYRKQTTQGRQTLMNHRGITMKRIHTYMVALLLVAVLLPASMASAVPVTYVTPNGATDAAGDSVSAEVVFTPGSGTLLVQMWNLTFNPKDAGQGISDLFFTLDTTTLAGTIGSSSGLERTINDPSKTFTDGSHVAPGWSFTVSSGTYHLDDLNGGQSPKHTILGLPNGSTYSNANASILGNHNPFLFGTESDPVSWTLNIAGVTANTHITSAIFSFGTESGDNIPGDPVTPNVPEPSTFVLLGSGLAGLAAWRWNKQSGKHPGTVQA